MIINLKFVTIEISVSLLTRKERVRRDLRNGTMLQAIKNYRHRYNCSLSEAYEFIKKVESEGKHANPNQ